MGREVFTWCALVQVVDSLRKGHQAMVFVHSRKDTGKTARTLVTKAQNAGETDVFDCSEEPQYPFTQKEIKRSRNRCAAPALLRPDHRREIFSPETVRLWKTKACKHNIVLVHLLCWVSSNIGDL